jgi:hypothetical protein
MALKQIAELDGVELFRYISDQKFDMLITLFLPSDQAIARLFPDIPLYVIAANNLPDPASITTYDGAAYHSSYFSFLSSIFPYKTIEADISNTYTSFYRRLVNFGFNFIFKGGLNELAV